MSPASSPCIRVCIVDRESGLCEGCGRTIDEIMRWGRMAEEERLAIMSTLPARMDAAFGDDPAPVAPVAPSGSA